VYATSQQLNGNSILTYQGGPGADKLLYSTVSVKGVEQSKKLGNTPGDTITLEGVTSTTLDNVVAIGHFNDGSSHYVLIIPESGGSGGASGGDIIPYPQPSVHPWTPEKTLRTYPTPNPFNTIREPQTYPTPNPFNTIKGL
jgi:hypothetical protein